MIEGINYMGYELASLTPDFIQMYERELVSEKLDLTETARDEIIEKIRQLQLRMQKARRLDNDI